jgi:hypothetical protein
MTTDKIENTPVVKVLGSSATFFSIIYAIILTLSISYNVGYFKQINPQIVGLMGLGDYIDDSIHNLWFFLLAALLFFSSSLAFIKIKRNVEIYKLIIFGGFALTTSSYFLLKGINYSKFWPAIKKLMVNESTSLYMWVIATLIVMLIFLIYRISINIMKNNLSSSSLGITPIIVFVIIVLMPYLGGMMQGYIEINYGEKKDYSIYAVDVTFANDSMLKEVFLVKALDKGVLVRKFKEEDYSSKFILLHWGSIKYISYRDIAKQ